MKLNRRAAVVGGGAALLCCGAPPPPTAPPPCLAESKGPGLGYCLLQSKLLRVRSAVKLKVGEVVIGSLDDHTAAVVIRDEKGLYARSAICPHACCKVTLCSTSCGAVPAAGDNCAEPVPSQLTKTGAAFLCPCHGSTFDADGAVLTGPATGPLPALAVRVDGSDVLVDMALFASNSDRA